MEGLLDEIRGGVPQVWAGWVHDGAPEKLPCVLLLEVGRSTAAYGDNAAVAARQTLEARIYAAERERCAVIGDLIVGIGGRRGFYCVERRAHADAKMRGITLTLERWMPVADGSEGGESWAYAY